MAALSTALAQIVGVRLEACGAMRTKAMSASPPTLRVGPRAISNVVPRCYLAWAGGATGPTHLCATVSRSNAACRAIGLRSWSSTAAPCLGVRTGFLVGAYLGWTR